MASPYQDFVKKARERFEKKQAAQKKGDVYFTTHAHYKMQQYGLSEQKVRGVMRNPVRREEGIVPRTVAVMQPVSVKRVNGKDTWKQEIWVMYVHPVKSPETEGAGPAGPFHRVKKVKVISTWRYPGVSPKRNPVPEDILRELEEQNILEEGE